MISNQILQSTIEGIKNISRVELCVTDAKYLKDIIILIQNRQKRKRKHNIYTTKYVKRSGEIRLEALS